LELFRILRTSTNHKIRALQPRICLQCWMIITVDDAPAHKGHNQTSDFCSMEEASRASFLGLCKQYDRLTPDGKQAILMKVSRKVTEAVREVQAEAKKPAPKKKAVKQNVMEVDLTDGLKKGKVENTRPTKQQKTNPLDMNNMSGAQNMQNGQQLPQIFNQLMLQAMQQSLVGNMNQATNPNNQTQMNFVNNFAQGKGKKNQQ
jgi:hypothetical protein